MKKELVVIVLVSLLGVGTVYVKSQSYPTVSTTPISSISYAPSPISTPAASTNIEVMMPKKNDVISSPLLVMGNARVFENVVSIRLTDELGNVLASENVNANSSQNGEFGPFEANLTFVNPTTGSGILEVYQISAKDGSEIDNVRIPVSFH